MITILDGNSAPVPLPDPNGVTNGELYGAAIGSNTLTRLANTTAYSTGQLIGGSASAGFASNGFTFTNAGRVAGGSLEVRVARLYKSQANQLGLFRLWLFRGQPTITIGDTGLFTAGVPVGAASAAARLIGRIDFDFALAAQGSDGSEVSGVRTGQAAGLPVLTTLPSNASDLFGLLEARAAYTPISGETFSVVLETYRY